MIDVNTNQQVEENWKNLRADIRQQWPTLTEEEVHAIGGDSRKLVALVHQKTGQDLSEIEEDIDRIAATNNGLLGRLTKPVADSVSKSPARSVSLAFASGIAAGLCLSLARRR